MSGDAGWVYIEQPMKEPWKLTLRNEAGQTIEFTLDELFEIAQWLRSHIHGEAPRS